MTLNLDSLTKQERGKLHHCICKWQDLKRVNAEQCRHCGGKTPCWSPFGDAAPGRRHTAKTYAEPR